MHKFFQAWFELSFFTRETISPEPLNVLLSSQSAVCKNDVVLIEHPKRCFALGKDKRLNKCDEIGEMIK